MAGATYTHHHDSRTQARFEAELPSPADIKYIELSENIADGQRVESFTLTITDADGNTRGGYQGTAIGHKKIVPFGAKNVKKINLFVTAARGEVEMKAIKAY